MSIAVIDTETATLGGEVFDFGLVIADKKGNILATYESIVKEVFENQRVMKGAYYFSKVPVFYRPNIRCKRMPVKPWSQITLEVNTLMKKHNVHTLAAYNLAFDLRVCFATSRKYGGFLSTKNKKHLDLWRVSCETLLQQKTFKKAADTMGWLSEKGNYKTSAEIAFKYAFGDWNFEESHTALDDAIIETQLMTRIFRTKKKINYGIISHPWRLVQDKKPPKTETPEQLSLI